jgi:hypothetical protein
MAVNLSIKVPPTVAVIVSSPRSYSAVKPDNDISQR